LTLLRPAHSAVMLARAATAYGQLRLRTLAQGQQRREHRQQKHCHQQIGKETPHDLIDSTIQS
jgi:hypothetical protein